MILNETPLNSKPQLHLEDFAFASFSETPNNKCIAYTRKWQGSSLLIVKGVIRFLQDACYSFFTESAAVQAEAIDAIHQRADICLQGTVSQFEQDFGFDCFLASRGQLDQHLNKLG